MAWRPWTHHQKSQEEEEGRRFLGSSRQVRVSGTTHPQKPGGDSHSHTGTAQDPAPPWGLPRSEHSLGVSTRGSRSLEFSHMAPRGTPREHLMPTLAQHSASLGGSPGGWGGPHQQGPCICQKPLWCETGASHFVDHTCTGQAPGCRALIPLRRLRWQRVPPTWAPVRTATPG